jgi:hypothetical protein
VYNVKERSRRQEAREKMKDARCKVFSWGIWIIVERKGVVFSMTK